MDRRRGAARRLVLAAAAAGVAALGGAALVHREDLRLEWWRLQAAREVQQPNFLSHHWGLRYDFPGWTALLAAGESGYPHLARLLEDPDPVVWRRAVGAIDFLGPRVQDPALESPVVAWLRSHHPRALARYLIWDEYEDGTEWRGGHRAREYWSGTKERPLQPTQDVVDFLESVLQGRLSLGAPGRRYFEPALEPAASRERALEALGAMLPDGVVSRECQARDPVSLEGRIIGLLCRAAGEDEDVQVRFHALQVLVDRSGLAADDLGTLDHWTRFARLGEKPAWVEVHESWRSPAALLVLLHLDHPVTLEVLARRREEFAALPDLAGILVLDPARDPLPVPLPRWEPLLDAARRLLRGRPAERGQAALALVRSGLPGGAGAIREALSSEPGADTRLLFEACLFALGDTALRERLLTEFRRRLTLASESDAELLSDLAFCLASSGDREALAALVETQLRARRFVSGLREVIEGYPYEGQYAFSTQKAEVEAEVQRWWSLMELSFDPELRLWRARLR